MDGQVLFSKHREWRGWGDTLFDFLCWLSLWKSILAALPKAPEHSACYFLRLPADIDSQLTGLRAVPFRCSRRLLNAKWKRRLRALRKGTALFLAPSVPAELMAGFPDLTGIPMYLPALSFSPPLPLTADSLLDCIRAMEAKTSKKFDWDAFFTYYRQCTVFFGVLENACGFSPLDISSPRDALEDILRHHVKNTTEFLQNFEKIC